MTNRHDDSNDEAGTVYYPEPPFAAAFRGIFPIWAMAVFAVPAGVLWETHLAESPGPIGKLTLGLHLLVSAAIYLTARRVVDNGA